MQRVFHNSLNRQRGSRRYSAGIGLALILLLCAGPLQAQGDPAATKGFMIESRPSGATVTIEGEIIGKTPCSFPYQLSGRYRLYAEKRGYETVSRDIDFGARKIETITFMLTPKTRTWAVARSLVFTGWGQDYSEQKLKSRIFMALEGACLVTAGVAHERCLRYEDVYQSRMDTYRIASLSLEQEAAAWQEVRTAYDDWKEMNQWRRTMLYAAAGVHLINFLDAIFIFPKSLRQIEFLAAPGSGQAPAGGNGFTISYTIPL